MAPTASRLLAGLPTALADPESRSLCVGPWNRFDRVQESSPVEPPGIAQGNAGSRSWQDFHGNIGEGGQAVVVGQEAVAAVFHRSRQM